MRPIAKGIFIVILFISIISSCTNKSQFTIRFAGDLMLDRGVELEMKTQGDSVLLKSIKPFSDSDFFVVNYEGTFTNSDSSQSDKYNFKANPEKAQLLKQSGISHVSIANNHIYDFGKIGFENTIRAIEDNNLKPLGIRSQPEIIEKNGYTCAVLSASLSYHNDALAIKSTQDLKSSVQEFTNANPKIPLILFLHWGNEYQSKPEAWQRELAKELVSLGAKAIIGHHSHVTQTIEFIEDVPVYYSIGNFVSDGFYKNTDWGFLVELDVTENIATEIIPYQQNKFFPRKLNPKASLEYIKDILAYSENICAYKQDESWKIESIDHIDFTENTNRWIFASNDILVNIKQLADSSFVFTTFKEGKSLNTIRIAGKLSEIHIDDIDNNNVKDIILGVTNKVHFDTAYKKRINIYTINQNLVQPLWLGTMFINDLVEFKPVSIDDKNILQTKEKDSIGNYYERFYEWDNFGFALIEN